MYTMVPHSKVYEFYNSLDCSTVPPFHIIKAFDTWAEVYNWSFKEYLRMRNCNYLSAAESSRLMRAIMFHVIANKENYK
mgnify:FL=1